MNTVVKDSGKSIWKHCAMRYSRRLKSIRLFIALPIKIYRFLIVLSK